MGSASSIANFDDYSCIRFIQFSTFKELGRMPRFPDDRSCTISLNELTMEEYQKSLMVFVSHCWLRGWSGAEGWDGKPHPDTADGGKYKLCVDGIDEIMETMASGMENCYLWLDFGCINQDKDPADELKLALDKIVQICDCIFTPVYDKHHERWEIARGGIMNLFDDYKSKAWTGEDFSIVNRGWCRLEMFYAANIPFLEESEQKKDKMKAGLKTHRANGRRAHFLYGSKEQARGLPPRILPALQNSYFHQYHPVKGRLTDEKNDRVVIQKLVDKLNLKTVEEGYKGEMKDGKRHGKGIRNYPNGSVFDGEWKDDLKHGVGRSEHADGCSFYGEYVDDKKNGKGKYEYADGGYHYGEYVDGKKTGKGRALYVSGHYFVGEWKDNRKGRGIHTFFTGDIYEGDLTKNKREGNGICRCFNGDGYDVYDGFWEHDKKHGKGNQKFANGALYEGKWKDDYQHGQGKFIYPSGEVYEGEWKDDKKHGNGKFTFADGKMMKQVYENGKLLSEEELVLEKG
jgi:hypothetical protein